MSMKLYVGNLGYQMSDDSLGELFARVGTVNSAQIITTIMGSSRGFGFVEMSSREEGVAAIAEFNGREIDGCEMVVVEERPPMTRAAGACFGGAQMPVAAAN